MIQQSDLSIIIPVWGKNPEERYALKESLTSLVETCECPIVVALNGGLTLPDEIDKHGGQVTTVEIDGQGQCKAVNAGVRFTDTPWIMVTNDDMIYPPGWFEKLTESESMCISPRLVEPRQGAPTFGVCFCGGAGGDFDKKKWLDCAKEYKGFGTSKGFNLPFLMKRELWDTIKGYDENYDPFGSNGDSDLEYKIRLAGVQPMQNTDCVVYHFSQTSGTFHPDNRSYWDHNWHYFISKWGFERASSPAIWTADFEIPMDKLKYRPEWMGKYGSIQ